MHRSATLVSALILVATVGFVNAPGASASITCDDAHHSHIGGYHVSGDTKAAGIRAPIKFRQDGETCQATVYHDVDFKLGTDSWIGIQQGPFNAEGGGLVQVGIAHYHDGLTGTENYCSFYEVINDGGSSEPWYNTAECARNGYLVNNHQYYYQIKILTNGSNPNTYAIRDCGGDATYTPSFCIPYGNDGWPVFSNSYAAAIEESQATGCTLNLMGSNGNHETFGASLVSPLQFQDDPSGAWTITTWPSLPTKLSGGTENLCTLDYHTHSAADNHGVDVWDDRSQP